MKKKWYEILKAENPMQATIMVYGVIGTDKDADQISAKEFLNDLNSLSQKYPEIKVRINSSGGSVFEGLAIYNGMKQCKAKISCQIDGMAASMASVIALGGSSKPTIASNGRIMIHAPSGGAIGQASDLRNIADQLESVAADMKAIYIANTGQDDKTVSKWMQSGKDTWFNADQAIAAGICSAKYDAIATITAKLDSLKADEIVAEFDKELKKIIKTPNYNTMEKKLLAQILGNGLTENSSDVEFMAVLNTLKNTNANLTTENANIKAQLEKSEGEKITAMLSDAKAAGKLTDAQIPHFEAFAKSNFSACKATIDSITAQATTPVPPISITNMIAKAGGNPQAHTNERDTWSFTDWASKDPKGLEAMETNNPDKIKALYFSQFKAEYKFN